MQFNKVIVQKRQILTGIDYTLISKRIINYCINHIIFHIVLLSHSHDVQSFLPGQYYIEWQVGPICRPGSSNIWMKSAPLSHM